MPSEWLIGREAALRRCALMNRRERGLEYCICESCAPSDLDERFVGGHVAGGDPVPGTVSLSEGEVCTHIHFYKDSCRTCAQGTHAAFLPDWQGVEDLCES